MNLKLFSNFLFLYLSQHKIRNLLILIGISLGIALFVSTGYNGIRAEKSLIDFSLGFNGDEFQYRISGNRTDLPEEIIGKIFYDPKLESISKVSPNLKKDTNILFSSGESLRIPVLGLNLFENGLPNPDSNSNPETNSTSNNSAILFSKALYDKMQENDKVEFEFENNKIIFDKSEIGLLDNEGGMYALLDLQILQAYLENEDRITYIYLHSDSPSKQLETSIQEILDLFPNTKLESREDILQRAEGALKSFRMNLLVVSMISVLISLFMISQNLSGLYFQRRKELAILRSIGASSLITFLLFLLQALVLGIPGTILGIYLGIGFTEIFSISVTTVTNSKQVLSYNQLPWNLIILSLLIGSLGSLFAGIIPSLRASRTSPMGMIREGNSQKLPDKLYTWFLIIGFSLIIPSYALAFGFEKNTFTGFLAIGLLLLGQILLFPPFFRFLALIAPRNFPTFKIGVEEILQRPLGNTFASGTFMLSVSLVLTLSTLTASYKKSLLDWVDRENPFDYSIVNSYHLENGLSGGVNKEVINLLKDMDEVESIDPFVIISQFEIGTKVYTIHALPFDKKDKKENSVFISSNLAYLENLKQEDILSIPTKLSGTIDFKIMGDREHFFSERGTIIMDLDEYERYFGIESFNSIRVKLKKNIDGLKFQKDLKFKLTGFSQLVIFDSEGLKDIYLSGLDKVFGTLESLKWTALFISAISIFAAVLHGLYDKLKLFGTLSILGATRRQIFSTMFASALSLTLSGALVGIFSALSLIPVVLYVINKNAFGWTLRFEFPWIWIPILLISVPLLSFLASIYPYWKIQKESLRNIFHEES